MPVLSMVGARSMSTSQLIGRAFHRRGLSLAAVSLLLFASAVLWSAGFCLAIYMLVRAIGWVIGG
jgi:hypothetical protein